MFGSFGADPLVLVFVVDEVPVVLILTVLLTVVVVHVVTEGEVSRRGNGSPGPSGPGPLGGPDLGLLLLLLFVEGDLKVGELLDGQLSGLEPLGLADSTLTIKRNQGH